MIQEDVVHKRQMQMRYQTAPGFEISKSVIPEQEELLRKIGCYTDFSFLLSVMTA